jgi:hypothetical protein
MKGKLAGFLALLVLLISYGRAPAATSPVVLTHALIASTADGKSITLLVHVENVADAPLSNLTLSLVSRPSVLKAGNSLNVGNLGPHQSMDLPLQLTSSPQLNVPEASSGRWLVFAGKCLDGKGKEMAFPAMSRSTQQRAAARGGAK